MPEYYPMGKLERDAHAAAVAAYEQDLASGVRPLPAAATAGWMAAARFMRNGELFEAENELAAAESRAAAAEARCEQLEAALSNALAEGAK